MNVLSEKSVNKQKKYLMYYYGMILYCKIPLET